MKQWQIKFIPRGRRPRERQKEIIDFLLAQRGIEDRESFFSFQHPAQIRCRQAGIDPKEINKAYRLINRVKGEGKKILVWGDYDADGIVGTAILWESLWRAGFDALPFIPDRADGYGLSQERFKKIYRENPNIGLVITVDNGIVAHREVAAIRALGVEVIITDHHALGKKRPLSWATLWSDQVCGATVAWFLARKIINQRDYALDLLAIPTITDMIPLVGINRSLVKFGLESLARTKRVGLKALMIKSGVGFNNLTVYHLGFCLGPRLNAMGRLYDALDSVRLLCTSDSERARKLAQKLEKANQERQDLTKQALKIIDGIITKDSLDQERLIFISHPDFHSGVIGLAASKLADRFYRPSVVLAKEDGFFRASCRSIKGFNIIEALKKIDCLADVGGHPLAAGFTVKEENLSQVKKKLLALARAGINREMLTPILSIDAQVNFADLDYLFWQELDRLEPFGLGNPEPLFYASGLIVRGLKKVGREANHLKLVLDDGTTEKIEKTRALIDSSQLLFSGIGFGLGGEELAVGDQVDIAFHLMINRYRGRENLELKIRDIRRSDDQPK